MSHVIRAANLYGYEELVRRYEANPVELLKSCGIVISQLREADNLINYESFMQALQLAAKKCGTQTFGLQLASEQGLEAFGLIGAFISKQASVRDALFVAQKYMYVHSNAFELNVNLVSEKLCEISIQRVGQSYDHYPQKVQLSLGLLYRFMAELVGSSWRAHSVEFVSAVDKDLHAEYEQFFHCPVSFSGQHDVLRFHPKFLAKCPNHNTAFLDQLIIEHFESSQHKPFDTLQQTRNAIKTLLSTGDCTKENVALCLNIHSKKLQRELMALGTNFRSELELIRKQQALHMLQNRHMSLTMIALNLGYAEYSVFSRRFKIWYGVSPNQYFQKKV